MDSNIYESRLREINELESYTFNVENEFKMIISELGLEEEEIKKHSSMKICPYDKGHSVPEKSYEKHIEKCVLRKRGYTEEELEKAPPSSRFYYENNPDITTIVIDKNLQNQILHEAALKEPFKNGIEGPWGIRGQPQILQNMELPLTNDRAITDLTEAERVAIYNYVVESAKSNQKTSEVTLEDLQFSFQLQNKDKEGKPKSKLEILAELRDYKRRRQSYRAKNVHITKKSYTEVMKEVISNMTVFLESMNEPTEPKLECKPSTSSLEYPDKFSESTNMNVMEHQTMPLVHDRKLTPSLERSRDDQNYQENRVNERSSSKFEQFRAHEGHNSKFEQFRAHESRSSKFDQFRANEGHSSKFEQFRTHESRSSKFEQHRAHESHTSKSRVDKSRSSTPENSKSHRKRSRSNSSSPKRKKHKKHHHHHKRSHKHKHKRVKKELRSSDEDST